MTDSTSADSVYDRNREYVRPGKHVYNTTLVGPGEALFRAWVRRQNVPFDPDAKTSDYDMRGFWKALKDGDPKATNAVDPNDGKLHYPDYWKTPYHQSFSNESQWATDDAPHWAGDKLVDKSDDVAFDDSPQPYARGGFADGGMTAADILGAPPEPKRETAADILGPPPAAEPAAAATPPLKDTGLIAAPFQGAASAVRGMGQTFGAGAPAEHAPTIAEQPLGFGDVMHPKDAAEKILYGIGESMPELVGGVAGGAAGTALGGGPETGVGVATGLVGGALGAGAMNVAKTLGPYYAAALKENPNDPDGAFQKAVAQAGRSGAISGIGWAAFGFAPFKSMVEKSLMKAFGVEDRAALGKAMETGVVQDPAALAKSQAQAKWAGAKDLGVQAGIAQPAVAVSGKILENIATGKPADDDIASVIPGAIAGTAVPAIGHAGVHAGAKAIGERMAGKSEAEPAPPITGVTADQVPKDGDVIGLKFPGAPSRRAKIEGTFDNGQSVRLRFDDGTARDYNTADMLRDRTAAPPPVDPDDAPPPARESEPVSEAESFDLQEAALAGQPQPTRTRGAATLPLDSAANQALTNAVVMERRANDLRARAQTSQDPLSPLPARMYREADELATRAQQIREQYGAKPTAVVSTPEIDAATEAGRQREQMGQLGRAPIGAAEREGAPLTSPTRQAGELEAEAARRYAPESGRVAAPDQGEGPRPSAEENALLARRYVDDLIARRPSSPEAEGFARDNAPEIEAEFDRREAEAPEEAFPERPPPAANQAAAEPPQRPPTKAELKQLRFMMRSQAAKKGIETKRANQKDLSLIEWIAAKGGISPADPNIGDVRRKIGRSQLTVPLWGTLINGKRGRPLDEIRRDAESEGYIGRGGNDEYQATGMDDLYDAMDREINGKQKVYRAEALTRTQDAAADRAAEEMQGRQAEAIAKIRDEAKKLNLSKPLTPDEDGEAGRAMFLDPELTPDQAVYDVLERYGLAREEELTDNASRQEGIDDGFKRQNIADPELAPPPRPAAEIPRGEAARLDAGTTPGRDARRGQAGEGASREGGPRDAGQDSGPAGEAPEGLGEPPLENERRPDPEYAAADDRAREIEPRYQEARLRFRAKEIGDDEFAAIAQQREAAIKAVTDAMDRQDAQARATPKIEKVRNVVGATDQFVLPGTEHKAAEAAAAKRGTDKERAELGMRGKKGAKVGQAGTEDLPLFGGGKDLFGLKETTPAVGVKLTPAENAYFSEIIGNAANRAEIMEDVPSFRIEGDRLFVDPKDHDAFERYMGESHAWKDRGERLPPSFYPGSKSDLVLRVARAGERNSGGLKDERDQRDINEAVQRTEDNKWRVHYPDGTRQIFDDHDQARRAARKALFPYQDKRGDFADFIQGRGGDWHDVARDWVMQRGRETGHEHIAMFDPGLGFIAHAGTSGERDFVPFPQEVLPQLTDPIAGLTGHHNHTETALSEQDITALAAAGLRNVVAHTVTGDVSAARLTDSFARFNGPFDMTGREKLLKDLYAKAEGVVTKRLQGLLESGALDNRQAALLTRDLVPRALQAAGVLDYVSTHGYQNVPEPLVKNILRDVAGQTRGLLEERARQVKPEWAKQERTPDADSLLNQSTRPLQSPEDLARFLAPRGLVGPGRQLGDVGNRFREAGTEAPGATGDGAGRVPGGRGRQGRLPGLGDEPAQTATEAVAGIREAAETVADRMESGAPGAREAGLKVFTPPAPRPGVTTAFLGAFARLGMFPRTLAGRDKMSARLYAAQKEQDNKFTSLLTDWRERVPTFLDLAKKNGADKLYAAEEVARLTGAEITDEGRSVVLRNDGSNDALQQARFSKPGETIKLSPTETKSFFERRDMFRQAWADYREGAARRLGWTGEPTSKALTAAAETQIGGQRKWMENVASVLKGIEDHERRGYVPFMRFGDYYIHVTPKKGTEPESLGGYPQTKWFELVESAAPKDTMFGKIQPEGTVPKLGADRVAELRKQFPEDKFDIDHGYLAKKENVLRNVGIPAIDKLMIAMEGNIRREVGGQVKEGRMTRDEANREKELWTKMRDALESSVFEEMKAGYKKQANNVPGYSEDWNRSAGAYMHGTAHNVAGMMHRDAIDGAFNDIQEKHPDPAVKKYWRDWRANMEDPTSPLSRLAGGASQAAFYWTLAANPSSSIIIALHSPQVAHSMLSMGMGKTGGLGPITAGRELYGALFNGIKALRFDAEKGLHVAHETLGRDDAERAYLADLAKSGELHAAGAEEMGQMQAAQAKLFGPKWKQVLHVAGSNIAAADQLVRSSAALAAYRLAKQPGALDKFADAWGSNQLFREMIGADRGNLNPETVGKFMLGQAAFDWGRANSIPVQRGGLGKIAFQFHQFQMRYLSAAYNLMANQGPAGKAAAGLMAANLWMLAGVNGLPFVQDVENGIDGIWKFLRGTDPMTDARVWSLLTNHGMSKAGAELMRDGPATAMLGVKLSSRLGFGDVASRELHGLDLVGAAPSIMWNAITGAKKRAAAHQGADAVAAQLAPAAIRNPMRALDVYPQQGVRSQTGKTQYVKPREFTAGDLAAQAFGFTPQRVSRAYETGEFNYRREHAKGRVPKNPYVSPREE